ncbi:RNA-directed DNA polymerase, eukaryota, reverse transcriptase zinc-binding domain protein [Tanacetum coccineum]
MVRDRFSNGSWSWNRIKPIISGRSCLDFARMLEEIHNMEVTQGNNSYSWYLSLDGNFSVSSLRHHIDDYMLPFISPSSRRCKMIPRKVNIFVWHFFLDRLPLRVNLSSRGLDLQAIMCSICNVQAEFLDHAFFSCDTASNVWRLIQRMTRISCYYLLMATGIPGLFSGTRPRSLRIVPMSSLPLCVEFNGVFVIVSHSTLSL